MSFGEATGFLRIGVVVVVVSHQTRCIFPNLGVWNIMRKNLSGVGPAAVDPRARERWHVHQPRRLELDFREHHGLRSDDLQAVLGDHKLNNRMVHDSWEIAVGVERGVFTKSGTIECLKELMTTEKGAKMRKNVSLLRNKVVAVVDSQGISSKNFDKL
ncbi:hypothetical protein SASPL_117921 [Salvia splendens]|uniref:Uncharacterized protein n=1 Tax=Salvia splendens TaxID=180675 RepID=A0A8X8Y0D8_SALSN|nr:hypothetical protein SASPL_117921 [Salvia splendens]